MNPVVQKTAVSLPSKQGVVDADAKALLAPNALVGFYEAALHKVKTSRTAERVIDAEEEDTSAVLTETETEAEAQAQVEALLTGVVEAEPTTLLLSATALPASEPAKATGLAFNTDNPLTYILPVLLLGTAMGGSDSAAAAPASEDHCDIDFTFPSRPTGATVQTVSLAALETEVQTFGDALVLEEGESLVVELGTLSELSGATTTSGESGGDNFLVTASGNVGDLYIDVGKSANAFMAVDVSGGVGDIALRTGYDTEGSVNVNVSAYGDVGSVTMLAEGFEAGGEINLDTSGGNVGPVEVMFANPQGSGSAFISAYAVSSGLALVGGNVGDVSLTAEGLKSEGSAYVYASGGDVGDVELIACGGSASAYAYVSAFGQLDGNGEGLGGSVGDLTLVANGFDAKSYLNVSANGNLSGGVYLGGGDIGNVHLTAGGGSAEAIALLHSLSGGSIGSITLQTSSLGVECHSASANVSAYVYGAGGQVAAIGDVTMAVYGGMDNSASVNLDAFSGGDIGNITATITGGGSGHIDVSAFAFATVSGSGGNIGDVSLTDTSWAGDHNIRLKAGTSIGDMSFSLGGGSADIRMYLEADVNADVGNISVAFDEEYYGSGSVLYVGLASGAVGANITVTGGSEAGEIQIVANDDVDGYEYFSYGAKVVGDIDTTGFAGTSFINLNTVEDGVSIDLGSGGSSVLGTLGADTINLGAGSDQIKFNTEFGWLVPSDTTDTITGFDAVLADETDAVDSFYIRTWGGDFNELTSNVNTVLTEDSVVTLVDLDGGQDLSTLEGLLAALNDDDGEYDLVDGGNGLTHTFATASETSADSFKLFSVYCEWGEFVSGHLLADVTMVAGHSFADLSASNFNGEII